MAKIPLNIKVAQAIIEAGYQIADENGHVRETNIPDSEYYLIFRPIPKDVHFPNFWERNFMGADTPEPKRIGTIYFSKVPGIYQSRFASNDLWTIIAEEDTDSQELDLLADLMTNKFNPTVVYIRRVHIEE